MAASLTRHVDAPGGTGPYSTPPDNDSTTLYGVIELESGDTFCAFHEKGRSDYTIDYLEQLLENYPRRQILLIWDQATYHTSHVVEQWVAEHPRITVMLLPKYSPELNPIEQIWRHLKDQVAANLTRPFQAVRKAVKEFFEQHRPIDLLKMAGLVPSS